MTEFNQILAQGMSALLQQTDTRQAIVEYIKALTDKEKPHEQWREVYWMQSSDIRCKVVDHLLGTQSRKYRLLTKAFWDERSQIGKFIATMTNDGDYGKPSIFRDEYANFYIHFVEHVIKADNYMAVIHGLIDWYETAHDEWVKITDPLPEGEK